MKPITADDLGRLMPLPGESLNQHRRRLANKPPAPMPLEPKSEWKPPYALGINESCSCGLMIFCKCGHPKSSHEKRGCLSCGCKSWKPESCQCGKSSSVQRGPNGLERAYGQRLDAMKVEGEILWWGFEQIKLRLADGRWFRPDFLVLYADGHWSVEETKGFERQASMLRLSVAAEHYPFKFVLVKKDGSGWTFKEIGGLWQRMQNEKETINHR